MSFFNRDWRDLMRNVVSPEIDQHLGGETIIIEPYEAKPNKPSVRTSLSAFEVCAIFSWRAKPIALGLTEMSVASRDPVFSVGYYAMPVGRKIERKYRLTRKVTGEMFEVTNVRPDGVSVYEIDVVQLGRPNSGDTGRAST